MTKIDLSTALGLILVEIDGAGIEQGRTYVDKNNGMTKPLPGRQDGYIWQGARYPIKVSIDIPAGQAPYRPGTYVMSGEMFSPGDFGRIMFTGTRNLKLIDVEAAARALAGIAAEESGVVVEMPKTGTK